MMVPRLAIWLAFWSLPLLCSARVLSNRSVPVGFEKTTAASGEQVYEAASTSSALRVDRRGATIAFRHSAIRIDFVFSRGTQLSGEGYAGTVNRFIGQDPRAWTRDIALAERVRVRGVQPGMDVVWYGSESQLEFDVVIKPGSDPHRLELAFAGEQTLELDPGGDLHLTTADGELIERRPFAYQSIGGEKRAVDARFLLTASRHVRFALGRYDHRLPLIIDPILSYASYLGGAGTEQGTATAVDSSGNFYVAGTTSSTSLGNSNVLLLKVPPSGTPVRTVLGGTTGNDSANAIVVDSTGNVYLAGATSSSDFPISGSIAIQSSLLGTSKAFVMALPAQINTLIFSVFFGGSFADQALGMALGPNGILSIVGDTTSPDFLQSFISTSVYQDSNHGAYDGFLLSLTTQGIFNFATYLGGSADDHAYAVAVDSSGTAYVTGVTSSTDFFPSGISAFQPRNNGSADAFVLSIHPQGLNAYWGTYVGGSQADSASGIALDSSGNVYIAGTTGSTDFPVSSGAYQTTYQGGASDGFVFALAKGGQKGLWGTFLGGSTADALNAIVIDSGGNFVVTGTTDSTNFPTSSDASQAANAGAQDAFLSRLSSSGASLLFSTYFGGTGIDVGNSVAVDAHGNLFLTGTTASSNNDLPVTQGAFQTSYGGGASDAFFAVFGCPSVAPSITSAGIGNAGSFDPSAIAPGGVIAIFGTNLACAAASNSVLPLSTSLAGVTVKVNTVAIPLFYVSAGQINAQLPFETPAGSATVTVTGPGGTSSAATITVIPAAPGIFANQSHVAALNQDGTVNTSTHGAKAGSIVTVFFTGQGVLDHAIATGAAAPASPLSRVTAPNSATIGGQPAPVYFMGMTPGFVGLAQANVTVPSLSPGDYPVVITIGGFSSKYATLTVSP